MIYEYKLSAEEEAGLEHELVRANKAIDELNARRQEPIDRQNRRSELENEKRAAENKIMAAEDDARIEAELKKPEGQRRDIVRQKPHPMLAMRPPAPKEKRFTKENYLDQHVRLILKSYVTQLANDKTNGVGTKEEA